MRVVATGSARPAPQPGQRRIPSLRARHPVLDAGAIARRRLVVGVLKRTLTVAAVAALALTLGWPQLTGSEERTRVAYRKPLQNLSESARVLAPHYSGRDDRDRPFTLTADWAEQAPGSHFVDLAAPRADVTLEDGSWVTLAAKSGRFDRARRVLDLEGEVVLHHDAGYAVHTAKARIDLASGRAEGNSPVAVQGPAGSVDAPGFRIEDKGTLVIFPGPARMLLRTTESVP